jgi:orotate phosphoribosyltransferase
VYFEKFRVLTQPRVLSALCAEIAAHFPGVDLVAGPTTGGIIIAFEVARQIGVDAVYVEDEEGTKTLRRGQSLPAGARVLVVDDVLTTGLSVRETIDAVKRFGGEVAGVGVLIDRAPEPLDFDCELFASYKVEAQSWAPDEVPDWLAEVPVTKPGTRKV